MEENRDDTFKTALNVGVTHFKPKSLHKKEKALFLGTMVHKALPTLQTSRFAKRTGDGSIRSFIYIS